VASRRPHFSPVREEDVSDFTSRDRRVNVPQLLKGQSENLKMKSVHSLGLIDALIESLICTHFFLSMSL
jgi:hypothetical protein